MSIANKLTQLATLKTAIKGAIENKGVTVGNSDFTDYPDLIADISGGSGSSVTTFYTGSSTIPGAKGGGGGTPEPPGPPGTNVTFYVSYPDNNSKVPDMFIVYDIDKTFTKNVSYAILSTSQVLSDVYYNGTIGMNISITSLTSTMATLTFYCGIYSYPFDPTQFQFAPIYLS